MKLVSQIIIVVLFTACSSEPQAIFYLENSSFDMPEVELVVHLSDSVIIRDTVRVDSIAPHFSIHRLSIPKGTHSITAKAVNLKVSRSVNLNMTDDRYIFIGFNYRIKGQYEHEEERQKFTTLYPKDEYPNKVFEFDSVSIPPEISVQVLDEEPALQ